MWQFVLGGRKGSSVMKAGLLLSVVTSIVLLLARSGLAQQEPTPATQPSDEDRDATPSASPVDAIRGADTPSAAVGAYARALASITPGDDKQRLAAEAAYVKRMIDFDMPELAESQARDLTTRDAGNAQAWAVLAASSAQRGNTDAALGQVQTAARLNSDDPFVQLTAGQLLAWYDTHHDAPRPPEMIRNDIVFLREQMTNRSAYSRAYVEARDAILDEPTATASAPTTGATSQPSSYVEGAVPVPPPPPPVVLYSEPEYLPLYQSVYPYSSCAIVPGYYYGAPRYGSFGFSTFSHRAWPWYRSPAFIGAGRFRSRFDCFPLSFHHVDRSPFFIPWRSFRSGGAIVRPGAVIGNSNGGRFHDFRGGSRPLVGRSPSISPTRTVPPSSLRQAAPSAAPRSSGSSRGSGGAGVRNR